MESLSLHQVKIRAGGGSHALDLKMGKEGGPGPASSVAFVESTVRKLNFPIQIMSF